MAVLALSPSEEDFFRTGDLMSLADVPEHDINDISELDAGADRRSLWGSVVGWFRS